MWCSARRHTDKPTRTNNRHSHHSNLLLLTAEQSMMFDLRSEVLSGQTSNLWSQKVTWARCEAPFVTIQRTIKDWYPHIRKAIWIRKSNKKMYFMLYKLYETDETARTEIQSTTCERHQQQCMNDEFRSSDSLYKNSALTDHRLVKTSKHLTGTNRQKYERGREY